MVAEKGTTVWRPDVGIPGPFDTTLSYAPPPHSYPGWLQVISLSPRDGAETILDQMAVVVS